MKTAIVRWVVLLWCVLPAMAQAATPLDYWQWRSPNPQGNDLAVVSQLNGRFFAAGEWGAMISSGDGTNWIMVNGPAASNQVSVTGLAYGNDVYVATVTHYQGGGHVRISSNGLDWKTATVGAPALTSLAFGNGLFIAMANNGDGIYRSSDGTNWTAGLLPQPAYKVSFSNGKFWASGGSFMSSSDGTNWDVLYFGSALTNFTDFAFGGGKWVATIGYYTISNGDYYFTTGAIGSSDGSAWTPLLTETADLSNTSQLDAVAYGGGRFVILGQTHFRAEDAYKPIVWTSSDATNWTRSTNAFPERPNDVIWTGDRFIAVGSYGAVGVSSDGLSWSAINDGNSRNFRNVSFVNNEFMALGNEGVILRSADGVHWTRASGVGTTRNVRDVIYQNGLYVAPAGSGKVLTSYDGNTWALQNTPRSLDVFGIAYGLGQFVVVGGESLETYYKYLMTSTDGTNWVDRTSALDATTWRLHDVAFGNGRFVAVGQPSLAATSTDGTNWNQTQIAGFEYLKSVTYGNGRFVAVGGATNAYVSVNGTNWSWRPITTGFIQLDGVVFADGVFVAVGERGVVFVSTNGTNWSQKPYVAENDLRGVAYGNGSFVAIGNNNTILQTLQRPRLAIGDALGGQYQLGITADPMRTYRLQSTDAFSPPAWTDIWTNYQTSWTTNRVLPATTGNRFYRIVFP